MTYEEAKIAARICSRYAEAVESKLYMGMKIDEAHEAIEEALHIAKVLDEYADKLDTVSPVDLG